MQWSLAPRNFNSASTKIPSAIHVHCVVCCSMACYLDDKSLCHHIIMRSIAFLSSKGGSGKSTLSIHIAVAESQQHQVVLIDCDPQGTVTAWAAKRERSSPSVIRADPSSIARMLDHHSAAGFAVAVLDCPPHAAAGTSMLLAAADHVVVPVQPTAPDLAATQRALAMLKACGRPYSFVLSRAPVRAPEIEQTKGILGALGPLAPMSISDRRIYARALIQSSAVTEIVRDDNKASEEIHGYWRWLDNQTKEMKPWRREKAA